MVYFYGHLITLTSGSPVGEQRECAGREGGPAGEQHVQQCQHRAHHCRYIDFNLQVVMYVNVDVCVTYNSTNTMFSGCLHSASLSVVESLHGGCH